MNLIRKTADAGNIVNLFEGTTLLGTGVADGSGHWNSGSLSEGPHNFTATATDVAGNVNKISNVLDPVIGSATRPGHGTVGIGCRFQTATITILWQNDNGAVWIWDSGQINQAHLISSPGVAPGSSHIAGTGHFDGNG